MRIPVWFARHGYHVAIQDVRGRGGSGGEFYPFRHEGRDGAEIDCVAAQAFGLQRSHRHVRLLVPGRDATARRGRTARGLVCIAPHMTAADLYHGWFYHHGALRLSSTLGWGIQMLREDARRKGLREATNKLESAWANVRTQAAHTPYASHPAIADPALPGYVRNWLSHRDPGDYWTGQDISTRYDRILVPALHIAGWFDTYLEGSIAGYLALRNHAGSEFARDHQYLFAGPWVHIPWGDRAGEADFGEAANLNTDDILLRWFNHWLKDSREFDSEPRIRYFALGPNQWRDALEWPRPAEYPLYLQSAGNANSRKGDGRLSAAAPHDEEPSRRVCLRSRSSRHGAGRRSGAERIFRPVRA